MPRVFYTDLFVTVNTHWPYRVETYATQSTALAAAIAGLRDAEEVTSMVSYRDNAPGRVLSSRVIAQGVEVSARNRHVHAHFVLELTNTHRMRPITRSHIQRRMQEYFNDVLGCRSYVHAELAPTSAFKNYAAKGGRTTLAPRTLSVRSAAQPRG